MKRFAEQGETLCKFEGDTPEYEEVRRLVDIASGKELRRFKMAEGEGDQVLAVTPNGKYLLSLGNLGVLRIEEMAAGTELITTPDDHPVCLFELATGKLVRELKMPTSVACPVAFSADGKLLAVGFGRGGGEIRVVDATTLEPAAALTGFGSGPHAMAFSPEGKHLIIGLNDGTALVWDMDRVPARKKEER